MENKKSIVKIQNFGRKIILKNIQKELLSSPLFQVETKSFAQLRKLQRDMRVKGLMLRLCSLMKLSSQELRLLEMGIVISFHPTNLFGDDKKKWHPQDEMMFKHCEILLVNLVEERDQAKLKSFLKQYLEIFKRWKEGDKQRTIEGIVISYHHRAEHMEKVRDDEIEENQKRLMLETLNQQLESLVKSLKMIEPNFPVETLKVSHKKMFEMYKKGWEKQFNNVRDVVLDSFKKHLKESINRGEYNILRNELVGISERLLVLCPKKIYTGMKKKFSRENIESIFYEENALESEGLVKMLLLLIDTSILFDSAENDKKNKEWKNKLLLQFGNLKENLPEILITINQQIDNIINQIKKLASKNKL